MFAILARGFAHAVLHLLFLLLLFFFQFWRLILIVAIFYMTPAVQFVVFLAGDNDLEHGWFNYKCAYRLGVFRAFNNVISNIGYVLLGLVFWLIAYRGRPEQADDCGLHKEPHVYYALAIGLVLEGICSSLYHVWPSRTTFQFDSAFMLVGIGLSIVTLYQKRHPRVTIGAQRAFSYFGLAILANTIHLLIISPSNEHVDAWLDVFWAAVGAMQLYLTLYAVPSLYWGRDNWSFSPGTTVAFFKRWRDNVFTMPANPLRFIVLLLLCSFNWTFFIVAWSIQAEFFTFCLGLLFVNFLVYLGAYMFKKGRHNERIVGRVKILMLIVCILSPIALYCFVTSPTNKLLTVEASRELNKPCAFLGMDNHDWWHLTSAVVLFCTLSTLYYLDDDLVDRPRREIDIF